MHPADHAAGMLRLEIECIGSVSTARQQRGCGVKDIGSHDCE